MKPTLMILIAGPYRSGTGDEPAKLAANVRAMEAYAVPLFRAGHLPVVGEWLALPLVALAGSRSIGDEPFAEIFTRSPSVSSNGVTPCYAWAARHSGADLMVQIAQQRGLHVYRALAEVPGCEGLAEPVS